MTVTYSARVSSAGGMPSSFVRLLKKWRGSIYKLIYEDLLIFLGCFYFISFLYRFVMDEAEQEAFHHVVAYFYQYNTMVPVAFVLGFYIEKITDRWWHQFLLIPWPDPVAMAVSSLLHGQDERGRKMRRTVMRYVCLSQVMSYALISPKVKRRFPTYSSLVAAGFLVENEKKIMIGMDKAFPKHNKYWIPIVWASSILTRARKEGRIRDDFALQVLNDELNNFRQNCMTLCHYDSISMPLVYTQTVTLAVYSYFMCAAIGQQWVRDSEHQVLNKYFPLFTTLEFFFYMGWLKVAETCICPFGEDDDDFEINGWIDRNIRVSYLIVDEMHDTHPELLRDQYWDQFKVTLPYVDEKIPQHSTAHIGGKRQRALEREQQEQFDEEERKMSERLVASQLQKLAHKITWDENETHIVVNKSFSLSDSDSSGVTPPAGNLMPSTSILSLMSTKSAMSIAPIWPESGPISRATSSSSFDTVTPSTASSLTLRALDPFENLLAQRRLERIARRQRLYKASMDYAAELLAEDWIPLGEEDEFTDTSDNESKDSDSKKKQSSNP